jgi:hypothetical protein
MKNTRIAPLACLLLGTFLTAGCTIYKNPSTCEARMREGLAEALPHNKLSVSHVGVGIGGSRVVVEGNLEGPPAVAGGASAPANASSSAVAAKLKKTSRPAAAECMFNGESLTTMHWLSPPELATSADSGKPEATQR